MSMSRRDLFTHSAAAATLTLAGGSAVVAQPDAVPDPQAKAKTDWSDVRYCLNTSTIRGHELPLVREIELVAKAGYGGIEPWIREIQSAQAEGHSLAELRKRIEDHNLRVEGAIGFADWIDEDETKRRQGLEDLKRDMDLVRQIGGTRMAAPPVGGTNRAIELDRVVERYGDALKIGREMGVTPMIELWGFSATLHRLGELMYVLVESGALDAALLLDVYHIYRGGSPFAGLCHVDGGAVQVLHMNDYPAIPRPQIKDADRVYPGDGVAPLSDILRNMRSTGFDGVLSLELFNPSYWKEDVEDVLRRGLASMKATVAAV